MPDQATIICPNGCPDGRKETTDPHPCLTVCPSCGEIRMYERWQTDNPQESDAEDRPAGGRTDGYVRVRDIQDDRPASTPTGSGLLFEVQVILGLLFLMGVLAAITYWLIQGVA